MGSGQDEAPRVAGEPDAAVLAALGAWDAAFAAGDPDAYSAMFTEDGVELLLYGEPLRGRVAIRADAARTFGEWDTGAWRRDVVRLDVHAGHAYSLSTYTETLVHRAGAKPRRSIAGRLVHFLREQPDGWRVEVAMNSHSRRPQELEP